MNRTLAFIAGVAATLAACATVPTSAEATPTASIGDARCTVGNQCFFPITKTGYASRYSDAVVVSAGAAGGTRQRITVRFQRTQTNATIAILGAAPGQFTVTLKAVSYLRIGRAVGTGTVDAAPVPVPPPAPAPCPTGTVLTTVGAEQHCLPPPAPAPAPTQTCADGTVIPAASVCPAPPPPPTPPDTQTCPDGTVVATGQACPNPPLPPQPPAPAPPPPPAAVTLDGVAPIASNFDTAPLFETAGIDPTTGTTIPASAAPDVDGAFRFICNPGVILADDPILYPGQPGVSHFHQMFGNDTTNASSTYGTLRAAGTSTCGGKPGMAVNRSAYWLAAMLDGMGNVVRPKYISIYYKRRSASDPKCGGLGSVFGAEGKCVPVPNGLKFIFGFDPTGVNSAPTGDAWFNCQGPTAISGHYNSLDDVVKANACPAGQGNQLGWIINAPNCWNGKAVDSLDHRSHVGFMFRDQNSGQVQCDANHPYVIPTFTMGAWYDVYAGADLSKWDWSCKNMVQLTDPRGKCGHADYFEGWDPPAKTEWTDNCINKVLNCSAGNMGSGRRIIGAEIKPDPLPKIVPISTIMASMRM